MLNFGTRICILLFVCIYNWWESSNSTSNPRGIALKKKDHSILVLIGSVLLSSSVFLKVFLLLAGILVLLRLHQKVKVINPNQFIPGMNLQIFTYAELEKATNGFKEKLGSGAFAIVFKGVVV